MADRPNLHLLLVVELYANADDEQHFVVKRY